ncbi:MAG TPA: tetratricopeptide repeat protein, partial [Vicinamibacterales bacterium]|nr:tetratricopeptide repeat protein [Vicinamibacterales bacterium]
RRHLRDVRPDLPAAFVEAVERALERSPERRYASAGEMEAALRPTLDLPPLVVREQPARSGIRNRAFAGLAAVLALAVLALIAWSLTRSAPVASGASIAVLPFSDLSSNSPAPYLAAALTDELIATLGQIHTLRVSSMTSTSRYKDGRPDLQTIARELGVDTLLEGTVLAERAPGPVPRVRVNVRLVSAAGGATLWTDSFERRLGDTFAIQAEIARAVASAVDTTLTSGEEARLRRPRQTNPAAEEAYLQGRVHLTGYGSGPARRALEAFERALRLDPSHAAAQAGAARSLVRLGLAGEIPQNQARARGLTAANTALDLDPESAEAHAVAADLRFFYDWDLDGAERSYRRSLQLNPSLTYARTYYGQFLSARRRHDEALTQVVEARRLDPQSVEATRMHGLLLYYKRDYQAAEDILRQALVEQPDSPGALLLLGRVAEGRGLIAEAIEYVQRAAALADADGGVPLRVQRVRLLALGGRTTEAQDAFDALVRESEQRTIHLSRRDLAYMYLALSQDDDALRTFEQSADERDPALVWLGVDPRVDRLRAEPRFRAILRRLSLL